MFPSSSLWELNYLDWYGGVEWKCVLFPETTLEFQLYHIAILYACQILTPLILTFITRKKKWPWKFFYLWVFHSVQETRDKMLWHKTFCKSLVFMMLFLALSLPERDIILFWSIRVNSREFSMIFLSITKCWICCVLLIKLSGSDFSAQLLPWLVLLEGQSISWRGYSPEACRKLLFDPYILLTLLCLSYWCQIIFFPQSVSGKQP